MPPLPLRPGGGGGGAGAPLCRLSGATAAEPAAAPGRQFLPDVTAAPSPSRTPWSRPGPAPNTSGPNEPTPSGKQLPAAGGAAEGRRRNRDRPETVTEQTGRAASHVYIVVLDMGYKGRTNRRAGSRSHSNCGSGGNN